MRLSYRCEVREECFKLEAILSAVGFCKHVSESINEELDEVCKQTDGGGVRGQGGVASREVEEKNNEEGGPNGGGGGGEGIGV